MDHLTRRATALAALGERDVGALLVTKGTHIRYLTGFSGSAGVLLLAPDPLLVVDFRYREQAGLEAPDLRVDGDVTPPRLWTRVLELLAGEAPDRLGVDTRNLTAEHYLTLEGAPTGLVDCAGLLEAQRAVKDEEELQALAEAAAIADAVIRRLPEWLRPGRTENEIAGEIERAQRNLGSERSAAPVLVSSGERSVLPHGAASARVLERGDPIVIDLSPVVRGYRADITRTFMLGKATPEYQRLHDAGMRAHEASIAAVRAGVCCGDVDALAREVLARDELDGYFRHSLGHGIGLDQHELPLLTPHDPAILAAGMVVTIEPGVYVPGIGGTRVEDAVLVNERDCKRLTTTSTALREL